MWIGCKRSAVPSAAQPRPLAKARAKAEVRLVVMSQLLSSFGIRTRL